MDNTGIGFIVWEDGVACSDDVVFDVERDPVPAPDGKKNLIETNTLKFNFIFEVVNNVTNGLKVFCIFKSGKDKYAFTGTVRGKSGALTVIDLHTKSERINEIIAKIKQLGGN